MRSQSNAIDTRRQDWSTRRLRLELDPVGMGNADGAWWPYSRNLVAELGELLSALRPGFGPVLRVSYHRDEWTAAPGELVSGGHRTRLDGYRHMPARTLDIAGVGATLTLRIITPVAGAVTSAVQHRSIPDGGPGSDIDRWLRSRRRATPRRGR
ncbi:DUF5994 family protein [Nocardia carnea]|uniref:DUF5994 family protein n=1 Tax=Nocardia carnea TaxID=37328 RepID=A0ABW7TI59_9NOCA|nr:DUF5994 family protein [Nocardia carnea]